MEHFHAVIEGEGQVLQIRTLDGYGGSGGALTRLSGGRAEATRVAENEPAPKPKAF